jgi:hypothetical protein
MSEVTRSVARPVYARHPPGDLAIWIFILAELDRHAALVNTLALVSAAFIMSYKPGLWKTGHAGSSFIGRLDY